MANPVLDKATKAAIEITGKRFCTHCRIEQNREGGMEIPFPDGLRYRWKCAGCIQRAKERSKWNPISGEKK